MCKQGGALTGDNFQLFAAYMYITKCIRITKDKTVLVLL